MSILVTEGIRNASRWDKSIGALLREKDPIGAIVNLAPNNPQAAAKHLKQIARGASNSVLWELTQRKYKTQSLGTTVEGILAKYEPVRFDDIRSMDQTRMQVELKKLIKKINTERQKLGTRVNELGFHGVNNAGTWVEITNFNDALMVFEQMNKHKV